LENMDRMLTDAELESLPLPPFPTDVAPQIVFPALLGTAEYQEFRRRFQDYPKTSLTQLNFRALLYMMLRGLKPRFAVEIGTLFAGTAEIFARALSANGSGAFLTIDPFGAERAPGIIAGWPEGWRKVTEFRPVNSMEMFMALEQARELAAAGGAPARPDFVFIDGNHEHEFALFDLLSAARCLQPGGVIILDNYYDYGVLHAARKFEAENPTWATVQFSPHPSFGTFFDAQQLDALYRIYVAPPFFSVAPFPVSFHSRTNEADGVSGFNLLLARPSPRGRLSYKVYLRTIPFEHHLGKGTPEEMGVSGHVEVAAGQTVIAAVLPLPLSTQTSRHETHRRIEIDLLFEGDGILQLQNEPEPRLFSRAPSKEVAS